MEPGAAGVARVGQGRGSVGSEGPPREPRKVRAGE